MLADSASCRNLLEFRQRHFSVSVQDVVSGKRDDVSARQNKVNALFHELPDIEIPRIHEGCRRDAKHVARIDRLSHRLQKELAGIAELVRS